MSVEKTFLSASPEEIHAFLIKHYSGTPESEMLSHLQAEGKNVIELPANFEPLNHFEYGTEDTNGWNEKLSQYDYIILYHGTTTHYQDSIP